MCSMTNHIWDGFYVPGERPRVAPAAAGSAGGAGAQRQTRRARRSGGPGRHGRRVPGHAREGGDPINTPDTQPFRAKLAAAGYYTEARKRFGEEAWKLLEQAGGGTLGLRRRPRRTPRFAAARPAADLAARGGGFVLVVVDMLTLLAGIVARYALHSPIVWADEFAGAVFLWMSMLGAVIALVRGEHMRFGGS